MFPLDLEVGPAPFPPAVNHLPPVMLGDLLVAEAEADDGDVQVVDPLGVILVLTVGGEGWAPRDDDSLVTVERLDGVFRLADLGQHAKATDLGRDEVGVLSAEIDDGDGVVLHWSPEVPLAWEKVRFSSSGRIRKRTLSTQGQRPFLPLLRLRGTAGQPEVAQNPSQDEENDSADGQETELEVHDLVHLLHEGHPGPADGQIPLESLPVGLRRGATANSLSIPSRSMPATRVGADSSGGPGKFASAIAPTESARVKLPVRGSRTMTRRFRSRTEKVYPSGSGSPLPRVVREDIQIDAGAQDRPRPFSIQQRIGHSYDRLPGNAAQCKLTHREQVPGSRPNEIGSVAQIQCVLGGQATAGHVPVHADDRDGREVLGMLKYSGELFGATWKPTDSI